MRSEGGGRRRKVETRFEEKDKTVALRIIKLYLALPQSTEAQVIGKQLLCSGTSVGAHCREAYRNRSDADYISKIEVGLQELEETVYWLELLIESRMVSAEKLNSLIREAQELTAILVTCVKNTRHKSE
ncbi:four helix bundle protein [Hydrococcus rivularis NIES-593]|uniref:Four helix bundle protein n=1 Tax=Hydrococcus rivularis NIES-593 TaxID=1921803 RepID=A0A1U7H965_9CYAN|nr:four helix bundle protein [Hydrococcus rivularis NIES-593]